MYAQLLSGLAAMSRLLIEYVPDVTCFEQMNRLLIRQSLVFQGSDDSASRWLERSPVLVSRNKHICH
jgi:hypothetical protein